MSENAKRIVLAGGSGFLGRALAAHFLNTGWDVALLTRSPSATRGTAREVAWDTCTFGPWETELEGAAAVVNLTGKSVNCRYDKRNRKEILDSRVNSTRIIGEAIGRCVKPPKVWLNASTATLYQHTLDIAWDEAGKIQPTPEAKDAFSLEVAQAWERAFEQAQTPGTRKVALRTAMVLGMGQNSVFPTLRRLVRLGLGGKMGTGKQFVSWIHESDFCRAVEWLLSHNDFQGPVNLAAPNPLPNREMMRTLRQVCHVPFGLPASQWMLEFGAFFLRTETELLIKSRNVVPGRLLEAGFQFQFPTIREAFDDFCARKKGACA
jgi:uncharacterized protein (TIGR01777 family)